MQNQLYLKEKKNAFVLGNKLLEASISRKRGNLVGLVFKQNKFGKWNGWEGHVSIQDELKLKTFQDTECPLRITFRKIKAAALLGVECSKSFKGADFVLKEIWEVTEDTLNWKLEIVLKPLAPARSLLVKQHFPYCDPVYGLGVWSAHWQYPTEIHRVANTRLAYGDICFGTAIPCVTLFKKDKIGFTIAKPLDFKTTRLFFHFTDYFSSGVYLETEDLGLKPGAPARTSFMIHPHEGDWRPGLGWLYKKYPHYFNPPNKKVREAEGGYIMTTPNTAEKEIKDNLEYDLKWTEIHGHFIKYGEYAPEGLTEWPSGHPKVSPESPMVGIKKTNQVIALCQKYGIKPLPYFQCAGDGYIPYVTKKYPDSIIRSVDGKPVLTWIECCLMNSDPQTKFGREMLRMIDRFVAMYPDMDGVFVDQLCYDTLDMAHDDGITMHGNKPAYRTWQCYEKPLKKLADIMHGQGKILFANGPLNVEVQEEIDGIMAEGLGWTMDALKYLCIAKPLLFLVYARNASDLEEMFLNCLVVGASYSVYFPKKTNEIDKVYKTYLPLIRPLYGRKWVFDPDPISVPNGMEGNVFRGEKDNYIVTLVSRRKSILEKNAVAKNVTIELRLKPGKKIRRAYSLGAGYPGARNVRIKRKQGKMELIISEHVTASTIVLE